MANKLQPVSFRNIDEFFDFLPEDELKMVQIFRKLVLDCLPASTEKLSYNVPFYRINKNVCFIWPSSVLWGKTISFKGVRFGFNSGFLLRDEINYLDKGTRKQVYWKDFTSINQEDLDILRTYLFEAAEIDREVRSDR